MTETKRKLRQVNLNLIPTLHALLRYRNVTKAGKSLYLTQSAVSSSLKKLREIFDDELLIAEGREMLLTPLARDLIEPLNNVVDSMQVLFDQDRFVPATATRHFRIVTVDYMMSLMIPGVIQRLSDSAPHITVEMIVRKGNSFIQLRRAEFDLILTAKQLVTPKMLQGGPNRATLCSKELLVDPMVCIVSSSDDSVGDSIGIDEYLDRYHVTFSMDPSFHASIERLALEEQRIVQNNRISVPEFWLLPLTVSCSDCIALVPESLAKFAAKILPIKIVESPIKTRPLEMMMIWAQRDDQDEAHAWIRSAIENAVTHVPFGDRVKE